MTGPWLLILPYEKPPLLANTSNRGITRGARMAKAEQVRDIRTAVATLARDAQIPPCDAIHVRLHYRPKDNRRRDPDGLMPTMKPCLDALVDAGIVPDDTARYVDWSRPVIHAPLMPDRKPALWLVIAALERTAARHEPTTTVDPHIVMDRLRGITSVVATTATAGGAT